MRVFISYRTDGVPDRQVCDGLKATLDAAGHEVFVDRKSIRVGEPWGAVIEKGIVASDFMILLLSEQSAASEMVQTEVEIARRAAAGERGRPKILPVRLAFRGALPYPLSVYVDRLQQIYWGGDDDTESMTSALLAAIGGEAAPTTPDVATEESVDPRGAYPQAQRPLQLPPAGGALTVDDPFYIARAADEEAERVSRLPEGQTLCIKGARQIGKSSLLMRVLGNALSRHQRAVLLDFQLFSAPNISAHDFTRLFLKAITRGLDLAPPSKQEWDYDDLPNLVGTTFMRQQILAKLTTPLMVACDEADLLFTLPFRNDFFAMLRAWHGLRAEPSPNNVWRRFHIVLVTSTEPYLYIDRMDQSPFNVATALTLEDFTPRQVETLHRMHGEPLTSRELEQLYELTAGQPFLTRRALYLVAGSGGRMTPSALFERAAEDAGPFGDHLRRHRLNIMKNPTLVAAFDKVLSKEKPTKGESADEDAVHRLVGAGLLKYKGGGFVPRCELYRMYFKDRLDRGR